VGLARDALLGTLKPRPPQPHELGAILGQAASLGDPTRLADEGAALVGALRDGLGEAVWLARDSVRWMHQNGVRGAFDNEWQGFYFEARGREVLSRSFVPSTRPPRSSFGHTTFDFVLNFVWDLKAHTARQIFPISGLRREAPREAVLNDVLAMRRCVEEQGLGFLFLQGAAVMDEDESFVTWQRSLKAANGVKTHRSNSGTSRVRKAAFEAVRLDTVWLATRSRCARQRRRSGPHQSLCPGPTGARRRCRPGQATEGEVHAERARSTGA